MCACKHPVVMSEDVCCSSGRINLIVCVKRRQVAPESRSLSDSGGIRLKISRRTKQEEEDSKMKHAHHLNMESISDIIKDTKM